MLLLADHPLGAGRRVTLVEREPLPGGRAGRTGKRGETMQVDTAQFQALTDRVSALEVLVEAIGKAEEIMRRASWPTWATSWSGSISWA